MAKEKVFRSGKKKRKKKKKKQLEEEQEKGGWKSSRKKRRERKRKDYKTQQELRGNQSKKKKKKKYISEEEYNLWNRAQTSGLTDEVLRCQVEVTSTDYVTLTEVNMVVDQDKLDALNKQKHNKNLSTILSKLP